MLKENPIFAPPQSGLGRIDPPSGDNTPDTFLIYSRVCGRVRLTNPRSVPPPPQAQREAQHWREESAALALTVADLQGQVAELEAQLRATGDLVARPQPTSCEWASCAAKTGNAV